MTIHPETSEVVAALCVALLSALLISGKIEPRNWQRMLGIAVTSNVLAIVFLIVRHVVENGLF